MSEEYAPAGTKQVRKKMTLSVPSDGPAPEKQEVAPELKRPAEEREQRRRRSGLGMASQLKLTVNDKDPDYEYRWVKGTPERINALHGHDDYDFVKEGQAGHESIKQSEHEKGLGELVERTGGVTKDGTPFNMVLMRKRRDWYEADQQDKQSVPDAIDEAIRHGQPTGPEGLAVGGNAPGYVPEGGISIKDGRKT